MEEILNNVVYPLVTNQPLPRLEGFALKSKPTDVMTAFRAVTEGADTADDNDVGKDVVMGGVEEEENDDDIGGDRGE